MASRRLPTCCFFQNKLNKKVFMPRDHCHRLLLRNSQDPQAKYSEVFMSPIWKLLLRSHWCLYQVQFHALSHKKSALLKGEWDIQTLWESRLPFCLQKMSRCLLPGHKTQHTQKRNTNPRTSEVKAETSLSHYKLTRCIRTYKAATHAE